MTERLFSIGEVAKRTGIPVKTLRFWSDEGLVPPSGRTRSGYRQYGHADLAKLDLVRTLRDAGLGLSEIGAVLRRELSLGEVLRLRLSAVESHIASLRNVASALRAALRSNEPSEHELRRLWTVTQLSNDERRATIARFYARVSEGTAMDQGWQDQMIDALAPKWEGEPTPEQLDAWIELSEILNDPGFVAAMRENSQKAWTPNFDAAGYQRLSNSIMEDVARARAEHAQPDSERAREIVEHFVSESAKFWQRSDDPQFRRELRDRFSGQDARAARVWELRAIMHGRPASESKKPLWDWVIEAMKVHIA